MADWQTLGSTTLSGALNDEAYRNYVSDVVGRDNGGMPMDYETWKNSYLSSWNVPTNADLNQYNINTLSSDGSNWGGQIMQQVSKNGQESPVFQDSWANGGRWSPGEVALLAATMFGGGAALSNALGGAAAGGAGAAGSVGAAEGASALGSLGAADTGVAALGSSLSPSALGVTAVAPTTTAAEIAALGSGIPSVAPSLTDLALQGAMRGAVTGGAKGLATGQNPLQSALSGAISGGLTGGITGGVNAVNPAGAGWVNSGITGGITSALGGGNPLLGAAGGAAGSLMNSFSNSAQPQVGGQMGDISDADYLNLVTGNGAMSDADYFNLVTGGGGSSGGFGNSLLNGLKGLIGGGTSQQTGGGNSALGSIIGGLLGAASSRGGTQTQSRAPWEAAQPYLKGLLADADTMRQNLAANPFTPQQTQAYGNAYGGLDQARAALPGLLQQGNFARPSYDQLFSQVKPR